MIRQVGGRSVIVWAMLWWATLSAVIHVERILLHTTYLNSFFYNGNSIFQWDTMSYNTERNLRKQLQAYEKDSSVLLGLPSPQDFSPIELESAKKTYS